MTYWAHIWNVSGCDLVTILDSVQSKVLYIRLQSLDSEETKALVQAMESSVEKVWLNEEETLDIKALIEYSGQGKCDWFCESQNPHVQSRREQLKTWAASINWEVNWDEKRAIDVQRPGSNGRTETLNYLPNFFNMNRTSWIWT